MRSEACPRSTSSSWPLPAGEVHVWYVDVQRAAAYELLAEVELARASRFYFEGDRVQFVAARAALRQVLARYTGADPADLSLDADDNGRPRLRWPAVMLDFNVSHTKDVALVAVAAGPVGIDVEHIDASFDWRAVARAWLPAREDESVRQACCGATPHIAFFRHWTAREAYLKALGVGVAGLRQVEVRCDPLIVLWEGVPDTTLGIAPLTVGRDCAAAVAAPPTALGRVLYRRAEAPGPSW